MMSWSSHLPFLKEALLKHQFFATQIQKPIIVYTNASAHGMEQYCHRSKKEKREL